MNIEITWDLDEISVYEDGTPARQFRAEVEGYHPFVECDCPVIALAEATRVVDGDFVVIARY